MNQHAEVADWDLTTRNANEFSIGRTSKPALGHRKVPTVRGPVLDLLYAQLKRCRNLAGDDKPYNTIPDTHKPGQSRESVPARRPRRAIGCWFYCGAQASCG
jgi:hypothetical protein